MVYMLGNGVGKQRASRTGSARRPQTWRLLFLSTGELTLAAKLGEVGKRAMAGLGSRLVNILADAGVGLGVFENLHGQPHGAAFADKLRDMAMAQHGTAGRAFLARLAQVRADDPQGLRDTLGALCSGFLQRHVPAGADGQVRSVAGRFALIGAAGELARGYDVVPWPEGAALEAAGVCFRAWLDERGGTGAAEDTAAIAQVRAFIEQHGESRFTALLGTGDDPATPEASKTINRAGFRRRVKGGAEERWEFLILPEAWKAEVCKGINPSRTAELLAKRKWLAGWTNQHPAATVRIPGEGTPRVYRLSGAILGDAEASDAK